MKRTIGFFVASLLVSGNAVMGTMPAAAKSAAAAGMAPATTVPAANSQATR